MRLILDEPKPIRELRKAYNDKVAFITTVKAYPLVSEIEFSGDYHGTLRKRRVPVRVGRKVDRAIKGYQDKLVEIWERYQKEIQAIVNFEDHATLEAAEKPRVEKADRITLALIDLEKDPSRKLVLRQRFLRQNRERLIKPRIDKMRAELEKESRAHFERVFRIGKERAQVLTDQELDDFITGRDRKELAAKAIWNRKFVGGLTDDLWQEYEVILGTTFETSEELLDAIIGVEKKEKRRLPLFAAAVGSVLLAAGTVAAARAVREDPETGETRPDPIPDPEDGMPIGTAFDGGFWHTRHDNRVCLGCEENDNKWMLHDQFQAEAGTNQCLTRCRCIELFEFDEKPVNASKIWRGTPGASIRNWPRFRRSAESTTLQKQLESLQQSLQKHLMGQHDQQSHDPTGGRGGTRTTTSTEQNSVARSQARLSRVADRVIATASPGFREERLTLIARIKTGKQTKGLHTTNGRYTNSRIKLHQKIASDMLQDTTPSKSPTLIFMGGLPGSGKSSIRRKKNLQNFVTIDSDEIKKQFPEYAGWNAALLQSETDDVITAAFARAISTKRNILFDGTMKTFVKYAEMTNQVKRIGYKSGVIFSDISPPNAMRRAVDRFHRSGRFVDPKYIATHDRLNRKTYDRIKSKLDFYELYDNNVEGREPQLQEKKDD